MFRKQYGKSKIVDCCQKDCERQALAKNGEGMPSCPRHKTLRTPKFVCTCGRVLSFISEGKFGAFFNCSNCGNINYKKVMSMQVEPGLWKINKAIK